LASLAAFLFFVGCAVKPLAPPLVETIAILPFNNASNEINAADILQKKVYLAMKPSAYRVIDIKETNEILKSKGITDGGQLPALDPKLIAKDLNVQALMYGSVEDFGYVNIGFYTSRKVTLALELINGTTGEKMWENTKTGSTRNFTLDAKQAQDNLIGGLAAQLVEKTLKIPLEAEVDQATILTLGNLPGFRFTGFAPDEDDPQKGIKKGAGDIIKGQIKGGH
jgi:hypothetical protein